MNIVHIISSLKIGGAETALFNLLSAHVVEKQNTHSVVYFHDGPNRIKLEQLGIPTYRISGLFSLYDPIAFYQALSLIKKLNPSLIHSSLWMANIFARLIGKMLKIPVICDLHGRATDEGRFRNTLDALTAPLATAQVAVSHSVYKAYRESVTKKVQNQYRDTTEKKITVILNGIDQKICLERAASSPLSRKTFGLSSDDFVIGAVGRLEPIKSYDILIQGFNLFLQKNPHQTKVKLVIVGDGSCRKELQSLALSLGISDKIIFVGGRQDAIKFYPIFDCFVLSSQSEGLSIALLEALCFGLPVITTNKEKRHDILEHGVHGLLIPPSNPQALGDALEILINNQHMQDAMKLCNKQLITTCGLDHTLREYKKLYNSIIQQ